MGSSAPFSWHCLSQPLPSMEALSCFPSGERSLLRPPWRPRPSPRSLDLAKELARPWDGASPGQGHTPGQLLQTAFGWAPTADLVPLIHSFICVIITCELLLQKKETQMKPVWVLAPEARSLVEGITIHSFVHSHIPSCHEYEVLRI